MESCIREYIKVSYLNRGAVSCMLLLVAPRNGNVIIIIEIQICAEIVTVLLVCYKNCSYVMEKLLNLWVVLYHLVGFATKMQQQSWKSLAKRSPSFEEGWLVKIREGSIVVVWERGVCPILTIDLFHNVGWHGKKRYTNENVPLRRVWE